MITSFISTLKIYATSAVCTSHTFFGFPTWYKYIKNVTVNPNGSCDFSSFSFWPPDNLLLILLAVLDMLFIVGGMVAVVFVIIGGVQYITSQGQPENTKNARGTVINALIGLAITIIAATLVNWLGYRLG